MTVTDRTDATDAEFRSRIAPFESAPTPPEVREARVVEEVARAMWADQYPFDHWDSTQRGQRDHYRRLAAAAVAAYRAAQDGRAKEAVRRVEALVEADHPRMIPAREVRTALRGSRQGHGASEGDPSL